MLDVIRETVLRSAVYTMTCWVIFGHEKAARENIEGVAVSPASSILSNTSAFT
jgi:hypothetical protein